MPFPYFLVAAPFIGWAGWNKFNNKTANTYALGASVLPYAVTNMSVIVELEQKALLLLSQAYNYTVGITGIGITTPVKHLANQSVNIASHVYGNFTTVATSSLLSYASWWATKSFIENNENLAFLKLKHGDANFNQTQAAMAKMFAFAPIYCSLGAASPILVAASFGIMAGFRMYSNYQQGKNLIDSQNFPYVAAAALGFIALGITGPALFMYVSVYATPLSIIAAGYSIIHDKVLGQYPKAIERIENRERESKTFMTNQLTDIFDNFKTQLVKKSIPESTKSFNEVITNLSFLGELKEVDDKLKPILISILAAQYSLPLGNLMKNDRFEKKVNEVALAAIIPNPGAGVLNELSKKCQAITTPILQAMKGGNFNIDHFLNTHYEQLINTFNGKNPNSITPGPLTTLDKTQIKEIYSHMVEKIEQAKEARNPKPKAQQVEQQR